MGLGQTMLTTMFLVLLTVAAVNSYKMINDQEITYYQEEAYKQSGILANALLQEIVRKKFDSQVDTSAYGYTSTPYYDFDGPASLGAPTAAISYVNPSGAHDVAPFKSVGISPNTSRFDDIDDYKGYHRSASAGNLDGFILTVDVYYVRLSSGQYVKTTANATYWKKIEVTVSNTKYLPKNLVYSTIASY